MGYEREFYKTESGRNPISDFIKALDKKQSTKIYQNISILRDFGADLHFPYVDFIKGDKYKGLMELCTIQAKHIFKTFYIVIVKDTEKKSENKTIIKIINENTCGYRWSTIDELIENTQEIIQNYLYNSQMQL